MSPKKETILEVFLIFIVISIMVIMVKYTGFDKSSFVTLGSAEGLSFVDFWPIAIPAFLVAILVWKVLKK